MSVSARTGIAKKVRELREGRGWTQAELSKRLGLSQSHLSEIERGLASLTAEEFLLILKLFNVSVTHFASLAKSAESEVQNALARLGASHLRESSSVLPSDLFEEVGRLVREVLVAPESPRHLTSLAPVLIRRLDRINLNKLLSELTELGFDRRLAWLIDNTLEALRHQLSQGLPREWASLYRRAEVVFEAFLAQFASRPNHGARPTDILDTDIRSAKTFERVRAASSAISKRWGIVTGLQTDDFVEALRASRVGD